MSVAVAAQTGLAALLLLVLAGAAGLVVGGLLSRSIARSREARAQQAAKARRQAGRAAGRGPEPRTGPRTARRTARGDERGVAEKKGATAKRAARPGASEKRGEPAP
jgi:type II secretory pathway pseudopilin PulG